MSRADARPRQGPLQRWRERWRRRGGATIDDRSDRVRTSYAPRPDGHPDPGEVVWVWVPFEDDPNNGKDRPALVIGREGDQLVLIALTSKPHPERDDMLLVGSGDWDVRHRPSWAKLEHLLRVRASDVRREGAAMDRNRYDAVIAALRERGTALEG